MCFDATTKISKANVAVGVNKLKLELDFNVCHCTKNACDSFLAYNPSTKLAPLKELLLLTEHADFIAYPFMS